MSDDFSRLEYDDELTDDDPVMIVRLSRLWLDKLIALAEILTYPEMWNPEDDVELALRNVDDLIVRLMGSEEEWSAMITNMPVCIPAVSMFWYPACNPVLDHWYSGFFLSSRAYADITYEEILACYFEVPLQEGNYVMTLHYQSASTCGKCTITNSVIGDIMTLVDMYSVSSVLAVEEEAEFEIETPGMYKFDIYKKYKNPAASGNFLIISAISVRRKDASE